ncbi:MAG TPA: class I SAM-dependent methyltransferase [Pyrinomonadaceae bacterium]|nr:class I SAM-dependent methyltransferase [Pyrinomonadaceae bacterium]
MRSSDQTRNHYLIEKELASRLRAATKDERRELYTSLYDELFRRVPDHPQIALGPEATHSDVHHRLALLRKYLHPNATYLEIGPGDCALAIEVAKLVRKVYAVDVSNEITKSVELPSNVELIISDGSSIPVPAGSIDIAYSDQVMEHLHPDDAIDQLRNIHQSLAPGGNYVCITPNRLSGPHDVSQYFDDVATGFHLKEYSAAELSSMFKAAGFRELQMLVGARGFQMSTPPALVSALESLLALAPHRLGRTLARGLPLRLILGVKLVGRK